MKASRAYITSLGTTGLLLCFALLLLVVVSALTAFRGWPGDTAAGDDSSAVRIDSGTPVTGLAPVRFTTAASASQAAGPPVRATAPARRARKAGGRDRGGVQSVSESGTPAPASAPAQAAAPGGPAAPVMPARAPGASELSDTVADTTQQVTQGVGATLDSAGAAPVGDVIRQTGDTAARSLPKLP